MQFIQALRVLVRAVVRTRHYLSLSCLVLLLSTACNKSDGTGPIVAAPEPPKQVAEAGVFVAQSPPQVHFDGKAVSLGNPQLPSLQPAVLLNAGAESATQAGPLGADGSAAGFEVSGNCNYSTESVAASSGRWRFELAAGCQMIQYSDAVLQPGSASTLLFNGLFDAAAVGDQLVADLVVQSEEGELVVLGSRTLSANEHSGNWQAVQVSVGYGQADAQAGARLGIRFTNLQASARVGIDDIELSTHLAVAQGAAVFAENWTMQCNQQWAGDSIWANRLQDWEVADGRLKTTNVSTYRPNRTAHRITTFMSSTPADFSFLLDTGVYGTAHVGSYSGLLLGAGGRMDYRSAALVHNRHGHNGGLIAGIDNDGRVFVLDHGLHKRRLASGIASDGWHGDRVSLQVDGTVQPDGRYSISVFARQADKILSTTNVMVDAEKLIGNVALVSNPGSGSTTHWFDKWAGYGAKILELPSRQLGPVLFASYTLSRQVLTVNAQLPPVCVDGYAEPELQLLIDGDWQPVAMASIDPESYTARFVVNDWDRQQVTRYRIEVNNAAQANSQPRYFHGAIQADPAAEPDFTMGIFNCRPGLIASDVEGWIQQNNNAAFSWIRERIVFPHEELLENAQQHSLDIVAFLGDQIYEFDPNGLVDKSPDTIVLDYLWKWYQFGWSAREIMRNTPSFVIPDDHDVYQGNVWGQGGRPAANEEAGGFVYPASFVNMVQKTQTGSLPDPASSRLLEQDIATYYTSIVYGGVGLAVLEDRKFKTGPGTPESAQQLLGSDQHAFLEQWAADWQGQTLKMAVSQSPFSQSTTHSGQLFNLNKRDLDSNGWPKTGRDDAVHLLRKAFAPHISGDQHLGMTLKHGIDEPGDAVYSFAGPSMLNIFPRIWDPDNQANGYGYRASNYRGQHVDAHGNFINVLAVANPDVYYAPPDPARLPSKNELGIGYGVIRLDKPARQYTFEAWPANVSPQIAGSQPYADWPVAVQQTDNDGRTPTGYLTPRQALVAEPIVQIFDESDDSLVYARRYNSARVEIPVFDNDVSYRVTLSDPESGYREDFIDQWVQ